MEIFLWFYNTGLKLGEAVLARLKVPRKPKNQIRPRKEPKKSLMWATFGLLESESRNEIYRKGVGES